MKAIVTVVGKDQVGIIAGVCGGIAEYFNIDPSIVRILALLLSIGSIGTGAIVYCVAALLIPKE